MELNSSKLILLKAPITFVAEEITEVLGNPIPIQKLAQEKSNIMLEKEIEIPKQTQVKKEEMVSQS